MENRHNLIKIKSLIFLKLRQQGKWQWVKGREIARAAGANPDSLYVLLGRWVRWNLVDRLDSKVFRYRLGKAGLRYLDNLPKWYEGNITAITASVIANAGLVLCWVERHTNGNWVHYIKSPFDSVACYHQEQIPPYGWAPPGKVLIGLQCDNALDAANRVEQEYGFQLPDDLLRALGLVRKPAG